MIFRPFRYSDFRPNTDADVRYSRILPVLTLLFLCSFLDRTNVGNAKTYGLEASLKMTDWQYDTGLAVYYATYIARYVHPFFLTAKLPKISRFLASADHLLTKLGEQ